MVFRQSMIEQQLMSSLRLALLLATRLLALFCNMQIATMPIGYNTVMYSHICIHSAATYPALKWFAAVCGKCQHNYMLNRSTVQIYIHSSHTNSKQLRLKLYMHQSQIEVRPTKLSTPTIAHTLRRYMITHITNSSTVACNTPEWD